MKTTIGKYRVIEDGKTLRVKYIYTISDITGSIWYVLAVLLGLFFVYASYSLFASHSIFSIGAWITGLGGGWLFLFGAYMLILGTSDLFTDALQVDKQRRVIIIRDILKKEIIGFEKVSHVFNKIVDKGGGPRRARFKYAMMCLKLNDGSELECFVIRSYIPIDMGKKVDKDLYNVSGKLKDMISAFIRA